jgi:hypothetical protein
MDGEDTVVVSRAELEELRKLKAELPIIIDKIRNETDKERLARLHEKQRENPEKRREQAKKHYEQNKDEILAKKKEAYQRKKAANAALESPWVCSVATGKSPDLA